MTLLILHLGAGATGSLLDEYCRASAPDPFPTVEAHQFATFLRAQPDRVAAIPFLSEVLAFEHALVRASLFGFPAEVRWSTDPGVLFEALDAGRLPGALPAPQREPW